MLTTHVGWKSGGRLLSLALLGGVTLSPGVSVASTTHTVPAQAPAHSWTKLQDGLLCRFWSVQDPSTLLSTPPSLNARSGATSMTMSASSSRLALQAPMMAVHPQNLTPNSSTAGFPQMLNPLGMNDLAADGFFGHCTQAWHVDAQANLISDDSAWVPNPDGAWPAFDDSGSLADMKTDVLLALRTRQQAVNTTPPKHISTQRPTTWKLQSTTGGGTTMSISAPPSGVPGAWTPVPGHPSYGMSDFAGDPWSQYFGYCTWYAWYRHQNEPLLRLGNASQWPWAAPSHGLRVGSTPVAGATVVFQPGVEGAGGGGHAAHVEAVLGGGWFIMSEMNFSWNGGGWGRVDWRYAYAGSGVSFIY